MTIPYRSPDDVLFNDDVLLAQYQEDESGDFRSPQERAAFYMTGAEALAEGAAQFENMDLAHPVPSMVHVPLPRHEDTDIQIETPDRFTPEPTPTTQLQRYVPPQRRFFEGFKCRR